MKKLSSFKTYISFPKNIQVIVISEAILALSFGIFGFLQLLYLNSINIPANEIGIIFSTGALFTLLGFIMGPFVKMAGRKTILASGCLICALGIGSYLFFTTFFMLLIGQIFINVGLCFIQVTELQLLYSYTTPDKECCVYSYKFSVNFVAAAVGGLLAGNINKIGVFKNIGYKQLFIFSIILLIATFIIRLLLLPKDERVSAEKGEVRTTVNNAVNLLKNDKKIKIFASLLFLLTLGGTIVCPFNNLILKQEFLLENNIISIIGFIITMLNMTGLTLMPWLIEKFTINKIVKVLFVILSTTTLTISFRVTAYIYIPVIIVRYFSAGLIGSSLDSSMMSNIVCEDRDVFAGVKILVNGIAGALGNFIGGYIINTFRYNFNFLITGILCTISASFFYIKVKKYLEEEVDVEHKKCCRYKHQYVLNKRHQ